ncbi:hypothetical protein J2T57_002615 [Natronocella acetinitrilica]|uniref:Ig-like domain-containing protein n=1 Tax=Natronocella acetinitrilica TaxID=414046 RepID=A0AAE3G452_9GAMM|nr:hypothetical protein [Natronocella acetinitrilica]MCP1675465.1 hypothetical protein [Natronocella acetinitrilica]
MMGILYRILIAACFAFAAIALAHAGQPTDWEPPVIPIAWDGPDTRMDGTPLDRATEVSHYTLLCGTEEGGPYDAASYQIPGLSDEGEHDADLVEFLPEPGTYYCRMTATDTDGLTSNYSAEELELTREQAPPGSPTNVVTFRLED